MNLQLCYHLGFAPLSLLCHHRLYPTVPCASSPFPRTSNAILYLLAACRNTMVLPCCVPATPTNVVVKTVNSDRVLFFPFSLLVLQASSTFYFVVFEMEQQKRGRQSWTPDKCSHVPKCGTRNACNSRRQRDKKKADQAAQQQANQEDMQQRRVTAAVAVSALAAACLSLSVARPPPAGLDRTRPAPVFLQTHGNDPENNVSNVWVSNATATTVTNNYPPGGHTGIFLVSWVSQFEGHPR